MKARSALSCQCVWLLLWVIGLQACSQPVPQLPSLGRDAVLLAFGDSLTFGTGAAPNASYPAHLQRLTGRTVINAGVPGELAGEGVERLERVLDEHAPQLLILCRSDLARWPGALDHVITHLGA